MGYNFDEWKKKKIDKGEWEEFEVWKKKKIEKGKWKSKKEHLKKKLPKPFHLELNKNILKREIILDTETTGLGKEDKIVEISLLELVDGVKTGRRLHYFFNPEKKISKRAVEIHQITNEKVADAPIFSQKAEDIIKFIGSAIIIAHNANFDRRMLNQELISIGKKPYPHCQFIDTLKIARYLFPNLPNNQDALCARFEVDNYNRATTGIHSALEDTVQLYFIYLHMNKLLKEKELNSYNFIL